MRSLVLVASIIHILLVEALLILMTLVDWVLVTTTAAVLQIGLAWVRGERFFSFSSR